MTYVLLLVVAVLLLSMAWGPGTHLEYAERVLRRRKEVLPSRVARILGNNRSEYLYGNLAADIINFKGYGGQYNHCHRWSIIDDFREEDDSEAAEAFALGYLSHLAADTIAHNHFVPYHLARFARTRGLGHLYWEMNADRFIDAKRWDLVRRLKGEKELTRMDELVHRAVPKKALSMRANKILFNHVLLVSERETWRRGMNRLHPIDNVALDEDFLEVFRAAAVKRIILALSKGGRAKLEHVDTCGKQAQQDAMKLRKQLVRAHRPGPNRLEAGAESANVFLEGMASPPPKA